MGNKSQIAGILSIISGSLSIIGGFFALVLISLINTGFWFYSDPDLADLVPFLSAVYLVSGIIAIILGILGIVGGIYSLKRRVWGLALAGAISAILTAFPLGIAAVILISLGKEEFDTPSLQDRIS